MLSSPHCGFRWLKCVLIRCPALLFKNKASQKALLLSSNVWLGLLVNTRYQDGINYRQRKALVSVKSHGILFYFQVGVDGVKAGQLGKNMKYILRAMPFVFFPFIIKFPAVSNTVKARHLLIICMLIFEVNGRCSYSLNSIWKLLCCVFRGVRSFDLTNQ